MGVNIEIVITLNWVFKIICTRKCVRPYFILHKSRHSINGIKRATEKLVAMVTQNNINFLHY